MKQTLLIIFIGLSNLVFCQTFPDLEEILAKEFPEKSNIDGGWVFNSEQAYIKKIKKPALESRFPNFTYYSVSLTNYLGYHVNQGTCVVLFDILSSKIILIEPLWYGNAGKSKLLNKVLINEQFSSKEALLIILHEIHELMETGSVYKFINTGYKDNLITFDLVYFDGGSYTTEGGGIKSKNNYYEDGVWRQIKIDILNLKVIQYRSVNTKTKAELIIK